MLRDGGGLHIYERALKFSTEETLKLLQPRQYGLKYICLNTTLLGVIYRPPNDNSNAAHTWLACMKDMLPNAYSESKSIILTGGFNIDLLKEMKFGRGLCWAAAPLLTMRLRNLASCDVDRDTCPLSSSRPADAWGGVATSFGKLGERSLTWS